MLDFSDTDLRFREKAKIDLALDHFSIQLIGTFDFFNVMNRPSADEVEVFSLYGSPIFCGAVPKHYKDYVSAAIQTISASVTYVYGSLILCRAFPKHY
jgi:hypothetical protein